MENASKYTERYHQHEILSLDVLDEEKELEFFTNIRTRIREVRKELGITQREFGESANIDRRYVAKVECGSQNPSFKFMRSVSIKHKISLDWLLYGVGDRYIKAEDENYGNELFTFKKLLDNATPDDIQIIMNMISKIIK